MIQTTPPDIPACRAVALLIDGENLGCDLAGRLITTTRQALGPLAVQRVYGDARRLNGWAEAPGFRLIHAHAGKNVTDMLLTIEAMELAFSGRIDGIAIGSRDRDFGPLAMALRARGLPVLGLAPDMMPEPLARSFSQVMVLRPPPAPAPPAQAIAPTPAPPPAQAAPAPPPPRITVAPRSETPAAAPAVPPEDTRRLAAIRTILQTPKSPAEFGAAMTKLGFKKPDGTNRWPTWLAVHVKGIAISGSGPDTRITLN